MKVLSVAIIALLTPCEARRISLVQEAPKQISADEIGDGVAETQAHSFNQGPEAAAPEESEEIANIKAKVKKETAKVEKANAYSKKMKQYFNKFDGTFHMPDGTR